MGVGDEVETWIVYSLVDLVANGEMSYSGSLIVRCSSEHDGDPE